MITAAPTSASHRSFQGLGGDVRRCQPEAGGEPVEVLEVAPSGAAPGRFQIGQHRAVDLGELVGGQRPGRAVLSVEILGEPLGGRHQRRCQRIAGRDGGDVALRVHPQHQPGAADIGGGLVAHQPPLLGPPVVELGLLGGSDFRAPAAHLHRDDVDAVEVNIELAQALSDRSHRQEGRRWSGAGAARGRRPPRRPPRSPSPDGPRYWRTPTLSRPNRRW